ncbi:MAG: acetyltransferase [Marinilabiliaceae bacterium]|nr:acetyltransferase [Marinilabiliaceae bacterium]
MLILGAGGHAKEVLEVLRLNNYKNDIVFFDNITPDEKWPSIFQYFRRIYCFNELKEHFTKTPDFIVGVGGIKAKQALWQKAICAGGKASMLLSCNASIGTLNNNIGEGTTIMQFTFVSSDVKIGKAVLINARANIHHDVTIGDFSEIAPSAMLLGRCKIGNNTFIGAGAIVLPDIIVGDNCTIGAGSVVTKNVQNNQIVKGNPAK